MVHHRHCIWFTFEVEGQAETHDVYGALYGETDTLGSMGLRELSKTEKMGSIDVRISPASDMATTIGTVSISVDISTDECKDLADAILNIKHVKTFDSRFSHYDLIDMWKITNDRIDEYAKNIKNDWFPKLENHNKHYTENSPTHYRIRFLFKIDGAVRISDIQGSIYGNTRILGKHSLDELIGDQARAHIDIQSEETSSTDLIGNVTIPLCVEFDICARIIAAVELINNVGPFSCWFRLDSIVMMSNEIEKRANIIKELYDHANNSNEKSETYNMELLFIIYRDTKENDTKERKINVNSIIGALYGETELLDEGSLQKCKDARKLDPKNGIYIDFDENDKHSDVIKKGRVIIRLNNSETLVCARLAAAIELTNNVSSFDSRFKLDTINNLKCGGKQSAYGPSRLACGSNAEESTWIILVEGRADVRKLEEAGYNNTVEIRGARVDWSIKKLCNSKKVVAFLDGDAAGEQIMKKLKSRVSVDHELRADDGLQVEQLTKDRVKEILDPVASKFG